MAQPLWHSASTATPLLSTLFISPGLGCGLGLAAGFGLAVSSLKRACIAAARWGSLPATFVT